MTDAAQPATASSTARRSGGREGRRALRAAPIISFPTLVREIPVYNIVPDEAVELIHEESLKIQKAALEQLIDRRLIVQEYKAAGYNLPESIVDDIREALSALPEPGSASLEPSKRRSKAAWSSARLRDRPTTVMSSHPICPAAHR